MSSVRPSRRPSRRRRPLSVRPVVRPVVVVLCPSVRRPSRRPSVRAFLYYVWLQRQPRKVPRIPFETLWLNGKGCSKWDIEHRSSGLRTLCATPSKQP